jgi:hypothetical protein
MIEIHEPKVEALLQQWMQSGRFSSAEDAIAAALECVSISEPVTPERSGRTGADIVAAFQKCPSPDFMPELETIYAPVSDLEF